MTLTTEHLTDPCSVGQKSVRSCVCAHVCLTWHIDGARRCQLAENPGQGPVTEQDQDQDLDRDQDQDRRRHVGLG